MSQPKGSDKGSSAPERWFTLFGLVVVRRTDLLAAAAFVLSMSTVSYQLFQFFRGANPVMYHPDTVYVYFDKYANGVVATRVAGQVSFTNNGDIGHNAIVREVSVVMTVNKRAIEETWLSFATVKRHDIELSFDIKESAHPVVISGGSASSYMSTFSPRVKDCGATMGGEAACDPGADFVSDTEFLTLLSRDKTLVLRFTGALFDSRRVLESSCTIRVTDDMFITLAKNDWYAVQLRTQVKNSRRPPNHFPFEPTRHETVRTV